MMYNDVIKLLTITEAPNAMGDLIQTTVEKMVFAERKSVGMREKYAAMATGLKPELVFVLSDYYDYSDQDYISYNDVVYRVLRTYQVDNTLEIVVTR